MDYAIKLNKNKNIGKVIYIVEGAKRELTLLSYIFANILDYSVIIAPRKDIPYIKYVSKKNRLSRVYLISAYESNISFIDNAIGQEYLNETFKNLYKNYQLELSNAATYFIFDRDVKSNKGCVFKNLIPKLKNSRDNGFEMNGLLLTSYPSIEAYTKSCIDNTVNDWTKSAKELKLKVSEVQYQQDKIGDEQIINACCNMLASVSDIAGRNLTEKDLDDFAALNRAIFDKEEDYFTQQELYRILSLVSISFIDLGLIELS